MALDDTRARWLTRALAVVAFREQARRWPRSEAADAAERVLGVWIHNQRGALRRGSPWLDDERIRFLDARLAGWRGTPRSAVHAEAAASVEGSARALGEFRASNGRWPSTRARVDSERRLAYFHRRQLRLVRSGGVHASSRRALLDSAAPGWDATRT